MNDPIVQLDELMQRMNLRCIATTLDRTAMPLGDFVADDRPTLLIVGSESDGLDQRLQQAATDRVTMAMNLGTDSLNVSVAAAVFMHHILHCQSQANPPSVPE
jgi:tRNA G18 (ribose-2'-O)-methylase SpoU